MPSPSPDLTAANVFSISAVERDTGLSKDTLRVWEKRYGFPQPGRDQHGERVYPAEQVEKLRAIKRLVDRGHRPSKLMGQPLEALRERHRQQWRALVPRNKAGLNKFRQVMWPAWRHTLQVQWPLGTPSCVPATATRTCASCSP